MTRSSNLLLTLNLAQQLQHQRSQRRNRQVCNVGRGRHTQVESDHPASAQAKTQPVPQVLPLLLRRAHRRTGWWWRGLDSNQRRRAPTDLQSVPFSLSGTPPRGTAPLGPNRGHCQRSRLPSHPPHVRSPRPHHRQLPNRRDARRRRAGAPHPRRLPRAARQHGVGEAARCGCPPRPAPPPPDAGTARPRRDVRRPRGAGRPTRRVRRAVHAPLRVQHHVRSRHARARPLGGRVRSRSPARRQRRLHRWNAPAAPSSCTSWIMAPASPSTACRPSPPRWTRPSSSPAGNASSATSATAARSTPSCRRRVSASTSPPRQLASCGPRRWRSWRRSGRAARCFTRPSPISPSSTAPS